MKYSKEDINNLMYKDYILLMAEELNNNGFTDTNGNRYEVSTNVDGDFVSDFSIGFVLSMKEKKAIDFLKEIGLLNNGRCPLTGLMLSPSTKTTYTSEYDSNITYDISSMWLEYTKGKRNWGCFISTPIIIVGIVWGIIKGFNIIAYITMGVGVLLAILSGMYGMSDFGNNWNRRCLANEMGINTMTLYFILKIENSKDGMCSKMTEKYGIPSADFAAYQKWVNNVD